MSSSSWEVNEKVHLNKTANMGLGVFATCDIKKNEPILTDAVRSFTGDDAERLRSTSAYHIFFVDREGYGANRRNCPLHLAVGATSIVNHNSSPNCVVKWDLAEDDTLSSVTLVAKKTISEGEELFISYHNIDEYEFE